LHEHGSDAQAVLTLTFPVVPMSRCRLGTFTTGDDFAMLEPGIRIGFRHAAAASGADRLTLHR